VCNMCVAVISWSNEIFVRCLIAVKSGVHAVQSILPVDIVLVGKDSLVLAC